MAFLVSWLLAGCRVAQPCREGVMSALGCARCRHFEWEDGWRTYLPCNDASMAWPMSCNGAYCFKNACPACFKGKQVGFKKHWVMTHATGWGPQAACMPHSLLQRRANSVLHALRNLDSCLNLQLSFVVEHITCIARFTYMSLLHSSVKTKRNAAYIHPLMLPACTGLHFSDNGPLTVQYLLVVDALNYCFWPGRSRVCIHHIDWLMCRCPLP